jgi:hypothetical protein
VGFPVQPDLKKLLPDVKLRQVEHIPEIKKILDEVRDLIDDMGIFDDAPEKIDLWIDTPNPGFGGIAPIQFICTGREKRLSSLFWQQGTRIVYDGG